MTVSDDDEGAGPASSARSESTRDWCGRAPMPPRPCPAEGPDPIPPRAPRPACGVDARSIGEAAPLAGAEESDAAVVAANVGGLAPIPPRAPMPPRAPNPALDPIPPRREPMPRGANARVEAGGSSTAGGVGDRGGPARPGTGGRSSSSSSFISFSSIWREAMSSALITLASSSSSADESPPSSIATSSSSERAASIARAVARLSTGVSRSADFAEEPAATNVWPLQASEVSEGVHEWDGMGTRDALEVVGLLCSSAS